MPSIRGGLSDIFGDFPLTHTLVRANKIVALFFHKCKRMTNSWPLCRCRHPADFVFIRDMLFFYMQYSERIAV